MKTPKRILALATAGMLAAGGPARAASADGVWGCKANGDIPLGLLTISGSSYKFVTTRTDWTPSPNSSDGSGTLSIGGATMRPQSGPLLDQFEVVGQIGDGIIWWNNGSGTLMACWPR